MKNKSLRLNLFVCLAVFMFTSVQLSAQVGTGYDYLPSEIDCTGGGSMPDTINGYICDCDGTGETNAAPCLQAALDSAASRGVALLIPATSGYYKLKSALHVNCSVMGIGGMPKLQQMYKNPGLRLVNNMTGWIYNLNIIGVYEPGPYYVGNEWAHNITIGGVNGVTIKNCLLERPQGDCITDNAQEGDPDTARNVLITNNSMIDPWRCNVSFNSITNRWAIINNYITYYSDYVDPIDLEPYRDGISNNSNIEVSYNKMHVPRPRHEDGDRYHYWAVVSILDIIADPGENIYVHHNFGEWGVPIADRAANGKGVFKNVVIENNVEGPTPPPTAPDRPSSLTASDVTETSFNLSWTAPGENVNAILAGYEIMNNDSFIAETTETSFALTGLAPGTQYKIGVRSFDAEKDYSNVIYIEVTTAGTAVSINSVSNNNIQVFPVPATSDLKISNIIPMSAISVMTIDGKVVLKSLATSREMNIDVNDWNRGIYILSVRNNENTVVRKVIVQ